MKYKPRRDIPEAVRELKIFSPKEIADWVLRKRNVKLTDSAVVMWFKRNPDIKALLEKEVIEKVKPEVVVSPATFERPVFETLPSVENFKRGLIRKKRAKEYIDECMTGLIRCCMGYFRNWEIDLVKEGKWVYKHPDRLDKEDVLNLTDLMMAKGVEFTAYKSLLENFLISKGIPITSFDLPIGKSRGYGKLARLYVEVDRLNKMLAWLKTQNFEAYVASFFMWLTGTRIDATLAIRIGRPPIGDITQDITEITVFDKAIRAKHPEGHLWKKYIPQTLRPEIHKLIGNRTEGKLFTISEDILSDLNRETIKKFCPDIIGYLEREKLKLMPNHFWRHMCAQHYLRISGWNYAFVAELGGWTPQALEESYGKPPEEELGEFIKKYLPVFMEELTK